MSKLTAYAAGSLRIVAACLLTLGIVQAQNSGNALSLNGSTDGTANLSGVTTLSKLTSWRFETRIQGISASKAGAIQVIWWNNIYNIYLSPDGTQLWFQNVAENNDGTNNNQYYCYVATSGVKDIQLRVQRNPTAQVYQMQAWNSLTGASMPVTGNCGSTVSPKSPASVSLTSGLAIGGNGWNLDDYTGAIAYARFYNTNSTVTTPPPDLQPAGTLLTYEFENASNLGAETSGNNYPPLVFQGAPAQVPTNFNGYSLSLNGSTDGTANLSGVTALSKLTSWRFETRIQGISASSAGTVQAIWWNNIYNVYLSADGTQLWFQNVAENNDGTNNNQYYCYVATSGVKDIQLRVQRNPTAQVYQMQAWNSLTGAAMPVTGNCGSTISPKSPATVSLTSGLAIGGNGWNLADYKGAIAYARFYNTNSTVTTPPPDLQPAGTLLTYEFENASNLGAETSGNNYPRSSSKALPRKFQHPLVPPPSHRPQSL